MLAWLAASFAATEASAVAEASSACEALNVQRNIDTHRTGQVTKAVLCDTQPAPCVSEFLFSHEVYWSEARARRDGGIKCARWLRDDDWPAREPLLTRPPNLGGVWESVLSRMPNRTLWLHGDSIMTQVCEAALCSLVRSGVVKQPPLCTMGGRHPQTPPCTDIDNLARSTGMQLRAVQLPNSARLLCSAVGVFEHPKIEAVLERADVSVAVINYGLHYHTARNFRAMLSELFGLMSTWAAAGQGRVPLFRELSAQHFKGGAWKPGADRPPPGSPCECEALNARNAADSNEKTASNQNVEFNGLVAAAASSAGVGVVPFFNLTVPRHNMHRRHFCSFSNQKRVGRCCDCTHFCYTPLFWDVFFADMGAAIQAHPRFGTTANEGVVLDWEVGRGRGRRRGRRRGGWARARGRRQVHRRDERVRGRELAARTPTLVGVWTK